MSDRPLDGNQSITATSSDSDIGADVDSDVGNEIASDIGSPTTIEAMQAADPLPRMEPFGPGDKEAAFWNTEADAIEEWAQTVPGGPKAYIDDLRQQMGWDGDADQSGGDQLGDSHPDSSSDVPVDTQDDDIGGM